MDCYFNGFFVFDEIMEGELIFIWLVIFEIKDILDVKDE